MQLSNVFANFPTKLYLLYIRSVYPRYRHSTLCNGTMYCIYIFPRSPTYNSVCIRVSRMQQPHAYLRAYEKDKFALSIDPRPSALISHAALYTRAIVIRSELLFALARLFFVIAASFTKRQTNWSLVFFCYARHCSMGRNFEACKYTYTYVHMRIPVHKHFKL